MNSPSPLYDHSNRLLISSRPSAQRVPCFSSKSVKLSANAEEEKGLSEDGENKLCLARPQISEGKEKTHLRFLPIHLDEQLGPPDLTEG